MTSSDGFFAIPIRGVEGRLVVDDTDVTVPDLDRFGGILGHGRVESEVVRASQLAERSRVLPSGGATRKSNLFQQEFKLRATCRRCRTLAVASTGLCKTKKKRNCKLGDNRKSRAQSLRLFHIGSVHEVQ